MSDNPSSEIDDIQQLLDRLQAAGDDSQTARDELVSRVYERLRGLARRIFRQDFPRLGAAHQTGTVHHEALLRIMHALEEYRPETAEEFFKFSAKKIRETLLDLARKYSRRRGLNSTIDAEAVDGREDAATMAMWTEVHQQVTTLPAAAREVFELCYYGGLSQQEAARVLGVSQPTVSRLWKSALARLPAQP